jgi:hypothetical protein
LVDNHIFSLCLKVRSPLKMENFIPFKICNLSLRFVIKVKAKTSKEAKDIIETKKRCTPKSPIWHSHFGSWNSLYESQIFGLRFEEGQTLSKSSDLWFINRKSLKLVTTLRALHSHNKIVFQKVYVHFKNYDTNCLKKCQSPKCWFRKPTYIQLKNLTWLEKNVEKGTRRCNHMLNLYILLNHMLNLYILLKKVMSPKVVGHQKSLNFEIGFWNY